MVERALVHVDDGLAARGRAPRRRREERRARDVVERAPPERVREVERDLGVCAAALEQRDYERREAARRREPQRGRARGGALARERVDRTEVGRLKGGGTAASRSEQAASSQRRA